MVNAVLKTEYITARELVNVSGMHLTTVTRKIKSGKYQARLVPCNGGQQYEILIGSVEPELQQKIYQTAISEQGGVTALLPVPFSLKEGITPLAMTGQVRAGVVQAPQKAKDEALAKYELLRNWDDFRKNYGKVDEFESAKLSSHLEDLLRSSENRHRLKLFINDVKITAQESAKLLGITKRAIQQNITSGKYKFEETTVRGGKAYLVYISNFDEDKQVEWFLANQDSYPEIVEMTMIANRRESKAVKKVNKTEIDREFVHLYNNAKMYPDIYELIGKVSINTLYRWKNTVGNTNDYTLLIPQYQYSLGQYKTQISEAEINVFKPLILHQNKMKISEAYNWTKRVLSQQGFTDFASESSYRRWVDNFMKKHYDVWIYAREGRKSYDDKVKHCIKRDYDLINVGDIWVADGHRLDFRVINPFTGQACRALIVAYQDMKSCAIAGFEIMINENTQCVASALRNSIIDFGKMPKICYQDNGRAFKNKFFKGSKEFKEANLKGLFERLGIETIFSIPYNSKAKPIEGFWKIFGQYERIVDSYIGNNIENQPAHMKRNEKYHKEIHSEFLPTIEQTIMLVNKFIEDYHKRECPHIKGRSIQEVWDEAKGNGVDAEVLDELMMSEEIRKINKNGVKFLNMYYWSPELSGLNQKVIIKYSLFDISRIKVYSLENQFICTATIPQGVHPAVNHLGGALDRETFKQQAKLNQRLENKTLKEVKKLQNKTNNLLGLNLDDFKNNPDVIDVTPKKEEETEENKFINAEWAMEPIKLITKKDNECKYAF